MTSMQQRMTTVPSHVMTARSKGWADSAIEACARIGYAAKGLVFGTVGILAGMTALGFAGGRIVGTEGAVQMLGSNAYGRTILLGIAIGLIAFVIWRLVEALLDPEHKGSDLRGLAMRAGFLISGAAYASLAMFTLRHLQGLERASDEGASERTRTVFAHEWGIWLVGAVGAGFVGVALYQLYRAYSAKFRRKWYREKMGAEAVRWATRISRIGIAARAVSFLLIGWFLLQAAVTANPDKAEGLKGALTAFMDERWGQFWLAGISAGFVCYGVYCFINARYREIPVRH